MYPDWTTVEMQSIKQRRRIRMAASDFLLLCCVIYRISTNAFVHIGHWNVGCRRCGASGILFISRVKNHICGASRSGESLTTLLTKKKSKKKGKNKRIHHHWQCGGGGEAELASCLFVCRQFIPLSSLYFCCRFQCSKFSHLLHIFSCL
ncbi:hypothetical protein T02_15838 [Trichinella nativa]|uniref:Uncharacterized protein n=1 Tax=Trichinella nativa TaxID=6335 RepID=A0A0V1LDJ1_9BILA|nr:hypothetical protein T02_15838 [Trichinella nativa]